MYPFTHIPLKSIQTDTQISHLAYCSSRYTTYIYQISALNSYPVQSTTHS